MLFALSIFMIFESQRLLAFAQQYDNITVKEKNAVDKLSAVRPVIGPTKFDRVKKIYWEKVKPAYFERVGYYAEDWPGDTGSLRSIEKYGQYMTAVVPFAYRVDKYGNLSGQLTGNLLRAANEKRLNVLVLVHNFNNNGFDRQLISAVLNDSKARNNLIENILKLIREKTLAGVNIDFENISPSERNKFNDFLKRLKDKLRAEGYLLTVSVPAKTWDNKQDAWSGGFDYRFIGSVADRVMLMTYDEHWFGGSPGPIASLPWVENVLKFTTSQIPKDKLLLGIGTYGYDWGQKGKGRTVSSSKALQLAKQYGAKIQWDAKAQVPYFYYWTSGEKRTVWFESTQSAALKAQLVKKYDVGGIAVWRLGFEDGAFWETMSTNLTR
ncbi:glycosyl hydrolase family 18 protein [Thermincola potens]|uniref:Glycoside hydrolase family 18 n=1 Tax=Thermincola potens (strain JR) TaxID=635013 RepID=D5XF25_THEPJ|nr:glycosyl hydrolase family 18 protein [Thermincola potens]ADG82246.1 glycoside hydrolase family 18 [Thermincola potens JR]